MEKVRAPLDRVMSRGVVSQSRVSQLVRCAPRWVRYVLSSRENESHSRPVHAEVAVNGPNESQ